MKNWLHSALVGGLLVGAAQGRGQNLVPNPSFEVMDTCPYYFGQWAYLADWDSPYTMSADLFSECSNNDVSGVPLNHMGYQQAAHGQSYAGLATYSTNPYYRELLVAELDQPLVIGQPVEMSLMASPGGYGSTPLNSAQYVSSGIGLKFFVDLPTNWQLYLFPNSAHLYYPQLLSDTSAWVTVSGSYVPDSAYRYVVLGNFFENSLTSTFFADQGYGQWPLAYAFVDAVCVSDVPGFCYTWLGLPHSAELVFECNNPFAGSLEIAFDETAGIEQVMLLDALGRLVHKELTYGASSIKINTLDLPDGGYVLRANGQRGRQVVRVLVHVSP